MASVAGSKGGLKTKRLGAILKKIRHLKNRPEIKISKQSPQMKKNG